MSLFQWFMAVVFCLLLPFVLALLNRASVRCDVNDKGLITDRSGTFIRTPLERIVDPLQFAIDKENLSYYDKEVIIKRILQKYTEAANWLFAHQEISKEYNSLRYGLSIPLEAGACLILSLYPVAFIYKRIPIALGILGTSVIVFFTFRVFFNRHPPKWSPDYQSEDYTASKLSKIDRDSSIQEIDEYYDVLLYPHIDRVKDQCKFMEKKTKAIKTAKTIQDLIIVMLVIVEVIVYNLASRAG